jgi:protein-tyrosine kinase
VQNNYAACAPVPETEPSSPKQKRSPDRRATPFPNQEQTMSKNHVVVRLTENAAKVFETAGSFAADGDIHLNGNMRARDEVLKLIHRTFLHNSTAAPRLVVFSAVEHGSGCSWVAAHAAESLASHTQGSVCLVDADLNTPSLSRYFGLDDGQGFEDAMPQEGPVRGFARAIRSNNLHLISGSRLLSNLSGEMSAERLKTRFSELCSEFSYVLIDAPPVNDSVDAMMLGQLSDGVILVLEANSTRREAARRAKESLESANVKVLGAVLNKRTFPIPKRLYNKF